MTSAIGHGNFVHSPGVLICYCFIRAGRLSKHASGSPLEQKTRSYEVDMEIKVTLLQPAPKILLSTKQFKITHRVRH